MLCKKCGTENPEGNEHCSKCGNNLKGKEKNIYSIIGLIGFIISLIIEIISLSIGNFICAIVVLVLSIICVIFSIMGIVKSIKIKKKIGKFKGIVISIISIILFLIISFFNIPMIAPTIAPTNTIVPLSNQEKAIYDSVKLLPSTLNVPESFRLYNVYLYQLFDPEYKEGKEPNPFFGFSIIIEYGGENKMGGVSRNYYVVGFKNNMSSFNEDINMGECKNFSDYYEADEFAKYQVALSKNSHKHIKVIQLNTKAIEKYINEK